MQHTDHAPEAAAATTGAVGVASTAMTWFEILEKTVGMCCMIASLVACILAIIGWFQKRRKK
jgi:hypothetical protein